METKKKICFIIAISLTLGLCLLVGGFVIAGKARDQEGELLQIRSEELLVQHLSKLEEMHLSMTDLLEKINAYHSVKLLDRQELVDKLYANTAHLNGQISMAETQIEGLEITKRILSSKKVHACMNKMSVVTLSVGFLNVIIALSLFGITRKLQLKEQEEEPTQEFNEPEDKEVQQASGDSEQ